jgi:hypothetical protein
MKTLLYIEWIKLSRKVSVWIFLGIYTLLIPVIIYWFTQFTMRINEQDVGPSDLIIFTPEVIWEIVAFMASYLTWFFVLMVISVTSDDLKLNIWRQHTIEGLSRIQLITSKLMVIIILAAASTFIMAGSATGMMILLNTEVVLLSDKALLTMVTFFLYMTGFMIAGVAICQLIKSTGITLVVMLAWTWFAEPLIRFFDKSDVTNFLITNSFNDLIINPVMQTAGILDYQIPHAHAVISSLVWAGLLIGFSLYRIRTTDL